ncbi:alpha/beta fold hydrolase [Spirulina sp. CS-785/01]|uniref:alpha/beta fold hydrolase n=1 Tax=Spirulina sp. CS-785/01 TaxID=3021716 RepID=UPI00232F4B47|nr:alpha/beta fold hydrolase [Spirulina sp. CS-785/01]MDB9314843.1 alpha/beta fold hydrolase [Spirulina sp. CS-785/01]
MQVTPITSSDHFPGTHWDWRGHQIYYVSAGAASSPYPPLLFIHGFGASTDHWRKNMAELQTEFSVWAIDLLGFGRSAKPNLAYSGDLWREQLQDFITEVVKQPVILVGNSLGGYASLCVAAQGAEFASGVVLLNSAGPFTEPETEKPRSNRVQRLFRERVRSLFLHPWVSYFLFQSMRRPRKIRQTLEKVYLDKSAVTDRLVEEIYRPSCDQGALQVFMSVFKSPQGEKTDVLLQRLSCPLLTIWGEGDPWMNCRDRAAKFRQYYPTLTEHFLQAGHCPHDEVPTQVNQLLRQWVQPIAFTKGVYKQT